jgi:hypothetical protein
MQKLALAARSHTSAKSPGAERRTVALEIEVEFGEDSDVRVTNVEAELVGEDDEAGPEPGDGAQPRRDEPLRSAAPAVAHDHAVLAMVGDEVRHLRAVEERGDSPATVVLVAAQVFLALLVVVTIEMVFALSFYYGWL